MERRIHQQNDNQAFLQVPFEALKRVSRERKHLLDSTAQLAEQLKAELQKGPSQASLDDRQKALQRARQLHDMVCPVSA